MVTLERIDASRILHKDENHVALNKPSGWLVHKSAMAGDRRNCLSVLRNLLDHPVWPVHRLDRKTSGVLLFALSPEAARRAMEQFSERRVRKEYLAIVRGWVCAEQVVDDALTPPDGGPPQEARTHVYPLAHGELPHAVGRFPTVRYSLLRLVPETGRWHQIRRHLNHISHPVLGDAVHGDGRHNRFFRAHFSTNGMTLHAWRLEIELEGGAGPLQLEAPPPPLFQQIAAACGWVLPGFETEVCA
jgi:tRNA pseudouridine65 synthase